jgi:hypothetical protein
VIGGLEVAGKKQKRLQATPAEVARLMQYVKRLKNGCWQWTACLMTTGYGYASFRGRNRSAHRLFFELFVGPIPKGKVVHHRCRNKRCVNPDHLEVTEMAYNIGVSIPRGAEHYNRAKTHCKRGHPLKGENLIIWIRPDGGIGRQCKACRREYVRGLRARKRRERLRDAALTSKRRKSA